MLAEMPYKFRLVIIFMVALIASALIFNPILKIAKQKNFVDNPDARKLQKTPVPVMGGIAVFFGIAVALGFYKTMTNFTTLFPVLNAMVIMLYLGSIDDILNIKPGMRFVIEILTGLLMLYGMQVWIADFQGLFGIGNVLFPVGLALSVLTYVGVINSINMIDGIDGLSSSFCILIMGCLGVMCFLAHQFTFATLSAASVGAILPFFIHNVFGKSTKMFIGDSGTMMVGTMISAMVFVILGKRFTFPYNPEWDFSRISFVIAVLSIPIADTLRVMVVRVLHKKSPFSADTNHFHHILLKYGFSCPAVVCIEIGMDVIVIASFFTSWFLGAGVNLQFAVTVLVAAFLNWFMAWFLNYHSEHHTSFAAGLEKIASRTGKDRTGLSRKIQDRVDHGR